MRRAGLAGWARAAPFVPPGFAGNAEADFATGPAHSHPLPRRRPCRRESQVIYILMAAAIVSGIFEEWPELILILAVRALLASAWYARAPLADHLMQS